MTNEGLKKKIVEILEETECEWTEEKNGYILQIFYDKLADALIAAGIGDVKDLQAQVNVLEITNIALQAGYDDAEKDRLYWVNKYKEAEHRADVAERALLRACKVNTIFAEPDVPNILAERVLYEFYIRQSEKELAEEREG